MVDLSYDPQEVAARYARVNSLRADLLASALEGDFDISYEVAQEANDLVISNLSALTAAPEGAKPHVYQAVALAGDVAAVGVATDREEEFHRLARSTEEVLREFAAESLGGLRVMSMVRRVAPPLLDFSGAPRRCLHARPSFDGHCLSRPPCP